MSVEYVTNLDDPRLHPYRGLTSSNLTRWSGRFIAEGRLVVERLLADEYPVESLLVSERRVDEARQLIGDRDLSLLVIDNKLARNVTGYNFHAGWLACGRRIAPPTLDSLIARIEAESIRPPLLVACPRSTDPDNLGGIIRLCAAFGVQALLLGHACADPFSRRTVRVSMGTIFKLPIIESADLAADLRRLRSEHQYRLTATVLDHAAEPLHEARTLRRDVLLLGNETDGLEPTWLDLCDRQLTIPMAGTTDSLNVTVAAGIVLHWLTTAAAESSTEDRH
ncbi:MAG: RNA methyltransferase [Planctomycetaceae bacterium]